MPVCRCYILTETYITETFWIIQSWNAASFQNNQWGWLLCTMWYKAVCSLANRLSCYDFKNRGTQLDQGAGVGTCADFPFADRTFADGHSLIIHLLTGPGHLLTQTFADFSHPCHLLTLEGRLLIQTFADSDNCWFCQACGFDIFTKNHENSRRKN